MYPQIVLSVPDDRQTEDIYRELGFDLPAWSDSYLVL
jgi:hypothetical protein